MLLFLTIFSGIFITLVIFVSCQKGNKTSNTELSVVAPIPLNLSDDKQQSDFKNYLKKTVSFLNDSSNTYLFRGYDLSNLSDNDKTQIANNMLKDHNFMSKLNEYQGMLRYIENRYRASAFTKEQWKEVIKFGMDQGIYFLPGLKGKVKKMEEKSLALMQSKRDATTNFAVGDCADMVDQANADLGWAVASLSIMCLNFSGFPPAAAFCWASVLALFWSENYRINSIEYWCACMFATYGVCVY